MKKIYTILIATALLAAQPAYSQETESQPAGEENTEQPKENTDDNMSYFNKKEVEFITKEKEYPWNYGRLTFGTDYLFALSGLTDNLAYESGFMLAFDHGIHHLFNPAYKRKSAFIPGLRIEFNFSFYGPIPVNSFTPRGGLVWLFPLDKKTMHNILLAGTVGMAFMSSDDPNFETPFKNNALSIGAELGYQVFLSDIFISFTGRFHYIYDSAYPWMGVGGQLAVGYRFQNLNSY